MPKHSTLWYKKQIAMMCEEMNFCVLPKYDEKIIDLYLRTSIAYCQWLCD